MTLFDPTPNRRRNPDEAYGLYRGTPPHVKGSDTSEAAAEAARPNIGKMQTRVLESIAAASDGLTCDEIEVDTGYSHQSASARIRELVLLKRLVDSGRRRPTRSGRKARIYVHRYGR